MCVCLFLCRCVASQGSLAKKNFLLPLTKLLSTPLCSNVIDYGGYHLWGRNAFKAESLFADITTQHFSLLLSLCFSKQQDLRRCRAQHMCASAIKTGPTNQLQTTWFQWKHHALYYKLWYSVLSIKTCPAKYSWSVSRCIQYVFCFSTDTLLCLLSIRRETRTKCPYAANCSFLGYIFH